jgi:hypothetical protein
MYFGIYARSGGASFYYCSSVANNYGAYGQKQGNLYALGGVILGNTSYGIRIQYISVYTASGTAPIVANNGDDFDPNTGTEGNYNSYMG